MDWRQVSHELCSAVERATADFEQLANDDRPYALCLVTADDGMSVGLSMNTEAGFRGKMTSEAEFEEMTPEYESYLRWAPAEWMYESWRDDQFVEINQVLGQAVLNDQAGGFDHYFEKLLETMTGALATLRAGHDELRSTTLFVTITDSDEAEAIERHSSQVLNPAELHEAFLKHLPE